MTQKNSPQPNDYDAVLGGETPTPVDTAVLVRWVFIRLMATGLYGHQIHFLGQKWLSIFSIG